MTMPKHPRHKKSNPTHQHKKDSLCDQRFFILPTREFKRLMAMLDKPPADNPRLATLMRAKAPWDKDTDRLAAIEAIREGIKDMKKGRVRDARTALEELSKKLGFTENMQ